MTSGLAAALAGQAPPQTAMSERTPDVRSNPEHEWYVSLQRIRMTTRDALIKCDEQDPSVKDFLTALRGICDKLLAGANAKASIASGVARAIESWAPMPAMQLDTLAFSLIQSLSQPPTGPGGMGAPMGGSPQMGAMTGGAPQAPPMAGPPAPAAGPAAAAL